MLGLGMRSSAIPMMDELIQSPFLGQGRMERWKKREVKKGERKDDKPTTKVING